MATSVTPLVDSTVSSSLESVCLAYKTFKQGLKYHRGNLKKLNDHTQARKELQDRDVNSQSLRGTFIQVVATWEKFVQDILKETIGIVIGNLTKQLEEGAPLHTVGEMMVKKALANSKFSILTQDPQKQVEAVEKYKEALLKKCEKHMIPVFTGKDGIDKRFTAIFETTGSLCEIITEMGPVKFAYLNKTNGKNENLSLSSPQDIEVLLRLFYGARCVYAHGNGDKTFQRGGVLYDFPERDAFIQQIGETPGDLLYIIYKYAKKYGKEAWVYYHNLVNLQRFILALAFRLFGAISKWVYDVFQERIWNFDPQKVEIELESDNEDSV